jgi:BMFP domain-containing protein YqiC
MRLQRQLRRFATGFLACVVGCGLLAQTGNVQSELPANLPDLLVENLLWEWHAQQSALEQLRTQQQATLQAIELTRKEMATVFSRNMDSTLARLDTMNEVLVAQREHDLEFIRNSNRRVLTVVSSLTGLLFLTMLLVTVFSTRAMNRLTIALSTSSFTHPQLNAPPEASLLTESGTAQLQSALEHLEQRITELENHSSHPAAPASHEDKFHAA